MLEAFRLLFIDTSMVVITTPGQGLRLALEPRD